MQTVREPRRQSLAGVLCLRSPLHTLGAIALLIGSWWLVSGVLTLIAAVGGAIEAAAAGSRCSALSVVGGSVVLLQPAISLVALEITLGVSLIVLGAVVMVDAVLHRSRR